MKGLTRWAAAAVVTLAVMIPADGSAQHAQTRQGFWLSAGLGWGSLGCEDCNSRQGGMSGNLALGGTLNRKVLLGVSSNGWTKEEGGARLTASSITAAIRFYPSDSGGFFLLGGLGLGILDASVSNGLFAFSASETGAAAILGLGYDIRVGRMISLSPYWNGVGMSFEGGTANFGQLGLGVTFH